MKYTKDEFIKKYGVPDNKLEDYPSATFYPMKTRTEVLQHLIDKYNLQSYCELGTQVRALNFDRIRCKQKFCVDIDPNAKADFTGSTDDFFEKWVIKYDLWFIDASHEAEQVRKDFANASSAVTKEGFICLHDVLPETYERTLVPRPKKTGTWNGSVWRFAVALNGFDDIEFYTVAEDHGVMVIKAQNIPLNSLGISDMPWEHFDKNRKKLLNLITWDEFTKM